MMSKKQTGQKGFTIIELMIATLVFSLILIVITAGILHFTTEYYKSVNTSAVQTATRNVANIIAQNLQYGGGKDDYTLPAGGATQKYLCIGGTQIDYNLGSQLGKPTIPGVDYGVIISAGNCASGHAIPTSTEYLGPNMRIAYLNVQPVPGGQNNLYTIDVAVAYGDIDLLCSRAISTGTAGSCAKTDTTTAASITWNSLQGQKVACKSGIGSQFCAVSHLTTEVVSRFTPGS